MSRPVIAALLSGLACPGAGQIYNRQYVKGGILVALTLALLGALFYVTWGGMVEVMGTIPPEKAMEDAFGLARRIMEGDKEFYDGATDMFTVVWVYGVVDAFVFGRRIKALPHPIPSPGKRGCVGRDAPGAPWITRMTNLSGDTYNIESGEDKAWRELAAAGPESVVKRSLAVYDAASGSYTLTVFGEEYLVSPATRTISNLSNPSRADEYLLRLAIPVYLVNARAVEPSGELVKEFTGGEIFFRGSHVLPTDAIAEKFGADSPGFLKAGEVVLGGAPVKLGDAAVEFRPFPRVSMTMILWLGDEEFAARASLLFDGNADRHMPMDVVWAVALLACQRMMKYMD